MFEPPLDPRENSLDRLEVWAVRYIPDPLDLQLAHQVLDLSCFVHGEVVHENYELPTLVLGREDLQVLFEALLVEGLVVQFNVLDSTAFRYSCTDRCVTGTRCLGWDAKVCVGPGPFKFLAGRFREHTLVQPNNLLPAVYCLLHSPLHLSQERVKPTVLRLCRHLLRSDALGFDAILSVDFAQAPYFDELIGKLPMEENAALLHAPGYPGCECFMTG